MEKWLNKLLEELGEESDGNEMKNSFECLMEAITSDNEKVQAMGESVATLCTAEKFTPFELASMSATLIVGACRCRAENLGVESTNEFLEHMLNSIKLTWIDVSRELKDDKCKDEDCSCKC